MWFLIVQLLHNSRPLCCSFCHFCLLFSASREDKTKTTKSRCITTLFTELNHTLFSICLFFLFTFLSFFSILFLAASSTLYDYFWTVFMEQCTRTWRSHSLNDSIQSKVHHFVYRQDFFYFFLHVHQIFIWSKDNFTHCFIAHHSASCPSPPNLHSQFQFSLPLSKGFAFLPCSSL